MPKVDQKTATEIVSMVEAGRISQDRKISNEMLQNYSEDRLKLELAKYKKESLSILSNQLVDRVTETETPSPVVHNVEYSGYFINEEEFNKLKELIGWTNPEDTQETSQPEKQPEQPLQSTAKKVTKAKRKSKAN